MKRLAVAGLGLIGARHARAVLDHAGADLACVIEPDPARRGAFGAPGFADLSAVDVPVDGVILATPTALHAGQAVAALERGWPVLVEKPIAADLAGADRIVAASRAARLPVLTGHHRRYHASVRWLRELLQGGEIGQPVAATAIWAVKKPDAYFQTAWRQGAGGSLVMINMVHEVDLLRFLLGEVAEVTALRGPARRPGDRPASGTMSLRFANGALATVAFADCAPSPWGFEAGTGENPNIGTTGQDYLWIACTGGAVSFPSLTVWSGAADWSQAPTARRVEQPRTDPLATQLGHFLDVLAGRAMPLIDAADARATLAATLQADAALAKSEAA